MSPSSETVQENFSSIMMLLQQKQLSLRGCSGSKGGFTLATAIRVALEVTFTVK